MMNSPFMIKRAEALAKELSKFGDHEDRIQAAYERLFSRPVELPELKAGLTFLGSPEESPAKWSQYSQVLLSSHEFLQIQ
jgi:hypothetical protein